MTSPVQPDATKGRPEAIRAVPVRHPGRWVSAAIVLIIAAQIVNWILTNDALKLDVVRQYLFDSSVLKGVVVTIELTFIAMVMGIILGIVLAVMRLSKNPIVSAGAWFYIWLFRSTPVLVQLLVWFNLPTVISSISVGIPFGPSWFPQDPKELITGFIAACLGLGLNEAAYMAEIARAGILSVDEGQVEAASALGMTRMQSMRRIVLPQAMRVIIPPTGNETISMLKTTSLASVIAVVELLYTVQIIYSRTYQTIPLLITACLWYMFMTSILSVGQYYLERRYARGSLRDLPPTPLQRLRRMVSSRRPAAP